MKMIDPNTLLLTELAGKIADYLKEAFTEPVRMPLGIWIIRSVFRIIGLVGVMFMLFWWPTEGYTPQDYEAWAARLNMLPEQMWTVVYIVIVLWSASEIIAVRQYKEMKKQREYEQEVERIRMEMEKKFKETEIPDIQTDKFGEGTMNDEL